MLLVLPDTHVPRYAIVQSHKPLWSNSFLSLQSKKQNFHFAKVCSWILKLSRTRAPSIHVCICDVVESKVRQVFRPSPSHSRGCTAWSTHTSKGHCQGLFLPRILSWSHLPKFILFFFSFVKVFPHASFFSQSPAHLTVPPPSSSSGLTSTLPLGKLPLAALVLKSECVLVCKTIMMTMMNIYWTLTMCQNCNFYSVNPPSTLWGKYYHYPYFFANED